jgi:hypothetical protein
MTKLLRAALILFALDLSVGAGSAPPSVGKPPVRKHPKAGVVTLDRAELRRTPGRRGQLLAHIPKGAFVFPQKRVGDYEQVGVCYVYRWTGQQLAGCAVRAMSYEEARAYLKAMRETTVTDDDVLAAPEHSAPYPGYPLPGASPEWPPRH